MASLNIDNSTIDDGNTSIIDGTHITHRYSLVIFPEVQYWKLSFQCWAGVKNCLTNIWVEKTNKLPFSILILELNTMQNWQKYHFWFHSNFHRWLHDTFDFKHLFLPFIEHWVKSQLLTKVDVQSWKIWKFEWRPWSKSPYKYWFLAWKLKYFYFWISNCCRILFVVILHWFD